MSGRNKASKNNSSEMAAQEGYIVELESLLTSARSDLL